MNTYELSDEQQRLIDQHLDMVLMSNETTNLTAITDRNEARILHIEDSLLALPEIMDAPEGCYADIGSGGGFPGIPLAIASERETTLVESLSRKARCLERFVQELDLQNFVSVYCGRAEELSCDSAESYAVITARAVSQLPSLLELASPLLRQHGWCICYKSDHSDEELARARSCEEKLGMRFRSLRHASLSDEHGERTIIVFEKVGQPTVRLPRRNGMAQKRPYA